MKRAVLVGVDHYDEFSDLRGCVADVKALEPLLAENGDKREPVNFGVQTFTSDDGPITRDSLVRAIQTCFAPGPDVALFYFSGHGASHGGTDVSLCVSDGSAVSPGVPLSKAMAIASESPVPQKIIVLDCCFSGAAGGIPQLGVDGKFLPLGTTILTASRGDQVALETGGRGRFTKMLCSALEGGAADVIGRVTAATLFGYVERYSGVFDQLPVYATNVDRLVHLRTCETSFGVVELHELAALFRDVNIEYPLSPEFERAYNGHDPDKVAIFELLQAARAVALVEPIWVPHMYDAAMQSKPCRLTDLGKHYCRLVHQRRPL